MRILFLLPLLLAACAPEAPQNAAEIADNAAAPETAPAEEASANATVPGPALATVGPLQIPYDAALLSPVPAAVPLPPDWSHSAQGVKLVAADRAELIGKAECMYGEAGEASRCNAEQEAGLAFAALPYPFAEASARLPGDQSKGISLAGAEGLSWEIGAEGEGAEYILLPAGERTMLIVRQYRTSGNPNEAALGSVLSDMRLRQ
jgi:hypothetical protein